MGKIFYWILIVIGIVIVSFLAVLSASKPAAAPSGSAAASSAVKRDAAYKAGVSQDQVTILSVASEDWPNTCLGINRSDVVCAQVVTPGYEIKASAKGKTYTYHTNASGSAVVLME